MRTSEPTSMASFATDLRSEWIRLGIIDADLPTTPLPERDPAQLVRRAKRADRARRWHAECPSDYRKSNWTNPQMVRYAEPIARVRSWQMQGQGMLITGPSGRGKSRALWDLLRRLMCREGREVRVFRSADFFRRLQEHIKYGSDESRLWLKLLAETPLLALDDWGQEAVTNARANWCEATFFDLLDQRLGNRLPIIITTNLTARQIADSDHENVRSDPLLRRLLDACHVVPFERAAE